MRKINDKAKTVSDAKMADLYENANLILADARRKVLNDQPFVGSIIMNLDIIPTRDFRIPTACTDGKKIYFDIDFLSTLSPDHQQFVLAHEVWHCVMAHFMRMEGRNHEIVNIAEDLEVNQILVQDGFSVPPAAMMPKKFGFPENLSAEEYYDLLMENKPNLGNSNGSGSGPSSESSSSTGGNSLGKLDGQFDVHITQLNDLSNEKDPGNIADKYGKVGVDENFQPNVTESQVEKMREITVAAAQLAEKSDKYKGDLPSYIKVFVNKLMTPTIKWQDVLSAFVTRTISGKSSWNKPNRRFVSSGRYLPSQEGESIRVGVILDTSGSTQGDIPKFLGELNGLVKSFSNYTLHILQVDTEVKSCETYNDDNPLDLENTNFEVTGFGGTMLNPGFKHILDNQEELECDCICVLTDGYTEKFTTDMDPGIPTLWLITENGSDNQDTFEFGEFFNMKN